MVGFHILDAPKIKRFSGANFIGMSAPASQAYAANGFIEPAAYAPRPIHIQPAAFTANAHIRSINILRSKVKEKLTFFHVHTFFHNELIWLHVARHRYQCVCPACFHVIALDATQRQVDGGLEVDGLDVWK